MKEEAEVCWKDCYENAQPVALGRCFLGPRWVLLAAPSPLLDARAR